MPQPYSNNFYGRVITHYDCTQSSFRIQYRPLTMTTFFEIAVYTFTCSNGEYHDRNELWDEMNQIVGVVVVYRTRMLAVTGSKHGNSYLELVYRIVSVVVVYKNGMLAIKGSKHGNSYLQLVYRVVGVVVVYRTRMPAVTDSKLGNSFLSSFCFLFSI